MHQSPTFYNCVISNHPIRFQILNLLLVQLRLLKSKWQKSVHPFVKSQESLRIYRLCTAPFQSLDARRQKSAHPIVKS